MSKDFELDDLVWARMKGYPLWPAKIAQPIKECGRDKKKHFVFFYGTENFAWIPDNKIFPHSKELLDNAKLYTKPKATLKAAIERIEIESSKVSKVKTLKAKSPKTDSEPVSISKRSTMSKAKSLKQVSVKPLKSPRMAKSSPERAPKIKAEKTPKIKAEKLPKIKAEKLPMIKTEKAPKIKTEKTLTIKTENNFEIKTEKYPEIKIEKYPELKTEKYPELKTEKYPVIKKEYYPASSNECIPVYRKEYYEGYTKEYYPSTSSIPDFGMDDYPEIKTEPTPQVEREKTPKVKKEKTPKVGRPKAPRRGRAPRTKVEKAPKTKVERAPKTKVIRAPKPKIEATEPRPKRRRISVSPEYGYSKTPLLSSGAFMVPRKGRKKSLPDASVKVKKQPSPAKAIKKEEVYFEDTQPESNVAVVLPLDPYAAAQNKMKATTKKIGFIGLGMMGQRIVTHFINTGHNVTIYNRTASKCQRFVDAGAKAVRCPADVVSSCEITFCCVAGMKASEEITFGFRGILEGLENTPFGSKGIVELSSIGPFVSEKIAEAITNKGGRYCNAVALGSLSEAEQSQMVVVASGSRHLFNESDSLFSSFSKNAYFFNPDFAYAGKISIIFNMFKSTVNVAMAETLSLIDTCNLSLTNFMEIMRLTPLGNSKMLEKAVNMRHQNFDADNTLKHQQNDLRIALQMGNTFMQPLLTTAMAHSQYQRSGVRFGEYDSSAVILDVRR